MGVVKPKSSGVGGRVFSSEGGGGLEIPPSLLSISMQKPIELEHFGARSWVMFG